MKKIVINQLSLHWEKAKHRKELKRRRNKEEKRSNKTAPPLPPKSVRKNQRTWKSVSSPEHFSIIENTDETVNFFERLSYVVSKGHYVFVDLSQTKKLTPESILYLLSRLHHYKENFQFYHLSGCSPVDEACKTLFMSSGFYKYVRPRGHIDSNSNPNILSVESGDIVDPKIAQRVKKFAEDYLPKTDLVDGKTNYATIIECMANTKNHAYKQNGSSTQKWWLMAVKSEGLNDNTQKYVKFIFLDNGDGIPSTIYKKIFGYVQAKSDEKIILQALQGKFESSTTFTWRGKGLPKIYQYFQSKKIANLCIASNKGLFQGTSTTKTHKLSKPFHGTLISWDIVETKEKK